METSSTSNAATPGTGDPLELLKARLRTFSSERDWDRYHVPKNLAMALACEAAEVMEHFLWQDGEASNHLEPGAREAVAEELADVLIYLVRLADKLEIDLGTAAMSKVDRNESRYPADRVRGKAVKYSDLDPA